MHLNLTDKHALVCGSTRGIGKACAMELARAGARITLIARDSDTLDRVNNELQQISARPHRTISVNFTQPDELRQKMNQCVADVSDSPVHILVNNTGGPPPGSVTDAVTEAFQKAFSQHLICNHILVQAVLTQMKTAGYGRIINIISTSVKQPIPNLGVSNTIRGAVASWAKTLAGEVGAFGITVNNVLPGATNTDRLKQLLKEKSERMGRAIEEINADLLAEIPARRLAEPHEIAAAVVFLASPAAGYINGINLPVDGGRTMTL